MPHHAQAWYHEDRLHAKRSVDFRVDLKYDRIEYYRTAKGREVDFVVTPPDGEPLLIQVAAEFNEPSTQKRELQAINEAMEELKIGKALIITLSHEERIETPAGQIDVCPAWLWTVSAQEIG